MTDKELRKIQNIVDRADGIVLSDLLEIYAKKTITSVLDDAMDSGELFGEVVMKTMPDVICYSEWSTIVEAVLNDNDEFCGIDMVEETLWVLDIYERAARARFVSGADVPMWSHA